ncbi:MAG: hypothetical protein JNN08_30935 [Bryobacterales bacterium]|nr:hypothetical protein [Bryobacterales bacterium]
MLIEYKISSHQGVITVTQRIEPDSSPVKLPPSGIEETPLGGKQLGKNTTETPPVSKNRLIKGEVGSGPGGKTDTGGGRAGLGAVIAFGPVVLLGAGFSADSGSGPGSKTDPGGAPRGKADPGGVPRVKAGKEGIKKR